MSQVGKAHLVQRDQGARSTGNKDGQKLQEPATKAYRDMAADAAEFQACPSFGKPRQITLQTCLSGIYHPSQCCERPVCCMGGIPSRLTKCLTG